VPESWLPVAGVAGLVLIVLLVGMAIAKRYRVARPNEAFIVTGRKGKTSNDLSGQKVVTGGGVFVLPFVQQLSVLDMSSRRITVEVNGAPSSQGIALNVSGVAIVKVHNEDVSIRAAAQRFGSQQEEIDSFTTNQLSGALRAIVGNLTVEQVIRDRESFSQQVLESVTGSLSAQGLSLDAFTIQEVGDHGGGTYILDMGRASAAAIRREAEIAEAEARRLSEEKRIHAETDRAKALSASAGPLEAAARQQEILAQEELVAERQAALTERQLDTTVRRPADAERYRLEQQAEAQRVTAVKAAEASKAENELRGAGELALRSAQARATELEGAAQAAAVLARGKADAEALQKRAEAYKEFNQAAVFDRLLETLPEIAKQLAAPMASIDTLTVVSTDGASARPKAVAGNFLQLQELIKSTTGLDLTQIVSQLTDSSTVVVPAASTNGTATSAA
jgi:flotillin